MFNVFPVQPWWSKQLVGPNRSDTGSCGAPHRTLCLLCEQSSSVISNILCEKRLKTHSEKQHLSLRVCSPTISQSELSFSQHQLWRNFVTLVQTNFFIHMSVIMWLIDADIVVMWYVEELASQFFVSMQNVCASHQSGGANLPPVHQLCLGKQKTFL